MARNPPVPETYYDRVAAQHALPLWVDTAQYVPKEPTPPYDPALWRSEDIRPLLMEAGDVVTPEEASRRVLVLQNPAFSGFQGTTRSLYACLQLILPGEHAPEHRHTQSALRLVLEGEGGITTVDGGRVEMAPGDFIITPSWTWHGHTHEGDTPMIWLDGLDNGLMAQMDTTFFEAGQTELPGTGPVSTSAEEKDGEPSEGGERVLRYPYDKARENLEILRKVTDIDLSHSYRVEYLNPADGGSAMPTMTTMLMLLDDGFTGQPYRSTDGTIFTVLEGEGETMIGGQAFPWKRHDIFVVPSWSEYAHRADTESVLFSFSDRVVQLKLGVWREARSS
ncbi:MAG: cupin domain-containing protein [Rhodospirillaceae bacterium]|nr:cupin domain-containing protein [Rhodospirillaceae bacterium]